MKNKTLDMANVQFLDTTGTNLTMELTMLPELKASLTILSTSNSTSKDAEKTQIYPDIQGLIFESRG